jgi:hypothetical protein
MHGRRVAGGVQHLKADGHWSVPALLAAGRAHALEFGA